MAKIVSSKISFVDTASTSYEGVLPSDYAADDWLFWIVYNNGSTAVTCSTSGWSVYTADSGGFFGGGVTIHVIYKKAASSSEAAPTASGASTVWVGNMIAVRGAPGTSPIEFVNNDFDVDSGQPFPSGTPAGTNTLLIYGWGIDSTQSRSHDDFLNISYLDGKSVDTAVDLHAHFGFTVHPTATLTSPPSAFFQNNVAVCLLAIKDDTGADIQGYVSDPGCDILFSGFNHIYTDDFVDAGTTVEDPTPITINGASANYSIALTTTNIQESWTKRRGDGMVPSTTTVGLNIYRLNYNGTTVDLSGDTLVTVNIPIRVDYSLSDDGIIIVLEDGSGNWAAYNIVETDLGGAGKTDYYWQFQPSTVTPLDETATAPTLSAIAKMSIGHYYNGQPTAGKRPNIQSISAVTGPIILAGGGTNGMRATDIYRILYGMPMEHAFLQGNAQLYLAHGIQCGDSSTACVMVLEFDSVEFVDNSTSLAQFADGVIDIVGPTKSDSSLTLGAVNGVNQYDIDMPVGSAGTCLFVGPILNANNIVLRDPATFRAGCLFSGYDSMTQNDADFSVGVNFASSNDAQAITINGATQAALQTLMDNLANCTFTSNTVGIRVEYTGTGDISLNFDGITWTSNTTDIHYNSTNASTLTAVMQNGSNASTSAISGSAVAVTISNDVTFTVNVQDGDGTGLTGAELTILTTGTQTEQYHVETMATSSEGFVFTAPLGVNVDIQVFKPGYDPYWESNRDLGSANSSITATLSAVQAYEA